ncbi:hypothetical protein HMP0015_0752 [Acinetobacter haemolyticus ATCC 19194]|uniref:Uncharacterized protein n=1 Tax=Acinetobacter haemolyticus ATCC 19194 TaxID=707232 RepID=D4XM10_ACIHA|nr:hypothetical protein HMP0015_0752 [Acinetobacter haemolyticus ATCC 19194]
MHVCLNQLFASLSLLLNNNFVLWLVRMPYLNSTGFNREVKVSQ